MANKTPQEKLEEQQKLKELSPYSLPDNPSQKGWSAGQIKSKLYKGLFYLYSLLDESRTKVGNVEQALDDLDLEDFVTEEEAEQIKNNALPHISPTPPTNEETTIWFDTSVDEEPIDLDDVEDFIIIEEDDEQSTRSSVLLFDSSFNEMGEVLLNGNDNGVPLSNDDSDVSELLSNESNILLNNSQQGTLLNN